VDRADEIARELLRPAGGAGVGTARPATVLLSPAAASFDMFVDYAARGRAFKAAVAAVAERRRARSRADDEQAADRWDRSAASRSAEEPVRAAAARAGPAPVSARQTSMLANPSAFKRDAHEPDYVILVAVMALTAIGILMVYSASAIPSYTPEPEHVPARGAAGAGRVARIRGDGVPDAGGLPLPAGSQRAAGHLALALLMIVLVPLPGPLKELSVSHNGSSRWIHLGPFCRRSTRPRSPSWPWSSTSRTGWRRAARDPQLLSRGRFPSRSSSLPFLVLSPASRTSARRPSSS
jgi:hypothetical protein